MRQSFLIEIMPVMFIPAGVGLLNAWGVLKPVWIPISVITVVTTVLVMAVTAKVTQTVIHNSKKEERESRTGDSKMREFLVHSVFFGAAVSLIGYEAGLLLKRKFKIGNFLIRF